MKKIAMAVMPLGISVLLVASLASAQGFGRRGGGGWGPGGRMYNPQTVETVSGTVTSIDQVASKGRGPGIHLMLMAEKETIPVHLGPVWYIGQQKVKIGKGDKIEVKGSRITYDGKPAIVAAEVRKGDQSLTLRDAKGIPAWAGRRRGQ